MPRLSKKNAKKIESSTIIDLVVDQMQENKAKNIILLDLSNVTGASFTYFLICHANSTTQVSSIAQAIEARMKDELVLKPWHVEGYQNSEWVLIDYGDVVVHVFLEEVRGYYRLEELWGDGVITKFESEL